LTAISAFSACPASADSPVNAEESLLLAVSDGQRAPELISFTGKAEVNRRPLTRDIETPMGSLWKLFVFFYIRAENKEAPEYVCKGEDPEEIFCCRPHTGIQMEDALAKSCGLFFSPQRLGINGPEWREFWEKRQRISYPWLVNLKELSPDHKIPVAELLEALAALRSNPLVFKQLNAVLERVLIDGTAKGEVRKLGSLYRVKTFTWNESEETKQLIGGFSGWLANGAPVWGMGRGTGAQVISRWAGRLAKFSHAPESYISRDCAEVEFFDHYRIKEIAGFDSKSSVAEGPLYGKYRVLFENGRDLVFQSNGEISYYRTTDGRKGLKGVFDVNEYVGRVLDREAHSEPAEAAKAFAVVIRTYLIQNAKREKGCYAIPDSTRYQRVSINPSSAASKRIGVWTDNLVLVGVPNVQYRGDRHGQLLSWEWAKDLAANRYYFDQVLAAAYPGGKLGIYDEKRKEECHRDASAESWIRIHSKEWSRALSEKSGYLPPDSVEVCEMNETPYSDFHNNKIFMYFRGDSESRITAAHEYLHLAFKNHPLGLNERFIEKTARELVLGPGSYVDERN
jgi:uncharacterized protein YfaQ (DUF2300 family)